MTSTARASSASVGNTMAFRAVFYHQFRFVFRCGSDVWAINHVARHLSIAMARLRWLTSQVLRT